MSKPASVAILIAAMVIPYAAMGQPNMGPPRPPIADEDADLKVLRRQIAKDDSELRAKKLRYEALSKKRETATLSQRKDGSINAEGMFGYYSRRLIAERGLKYDQETAQQVESPPTDPCNPQKLFVRANSLDNYLYGITPANKAIGASVSYLDDRVGGVRNVALNGMVSYVVLRDLCPATPNGSAPFVSGYSVAPFVFGHGTLTDPRSKKEESVAKVGVEAAVEVSRGWPSRQVFTIAPYYLSDYRGEARAQGFNGYWDFYESGLHLGGYVDTNPYLGWFVQARVETDIRNVDAVGVTGLDVARYVWTGGTLRANFFLFPNTTDVAPAFRNRISLVGEYSWFEDLQSRTTIRKYKATAKYNISDSGNSSIQVEYTRGTDKDTMIYLNQVLLKLAYAF